MPFYAVRRGKNPGVYKTWPECQEQTVGFKGAVFKKFDTEELAWDFVNNVSSGSGDKAKDKQKRSQTDEDASGSSEPPLKKSKSAGSAAGTDGTFTGASFSDKDGTVVYTDGASFNNGKAGARAGIGVFWGEGNPHNVSKRLEGRQTNNRAEIHAALIAVEQAKKMGIKNLILHTDSNFLINGITSWIKGWKKRGWKLSTGGPVINKEDFEELDGALEGMNVKWVFVRGHNGIPGNEAADRLANEGAKKPSAEK